MPSTFFAPSFIAFCLASSISSSCPTSAWKSKYISLSRTNTCCVYLNVYPWICERRKPPASRAASKQLPHQFDTDESSTPNEQVHDIRISVSFTFQGEKTIKTHNLSKRLKIVTFVTKTYHAISTHHKRNNLVSLFLQPKQDTRCIKAATVG